MVDEKSVHFAKGETLDNKTIKKNFEKQFCKGVILRIRKLLLIPLIPQKNW